MDNYNSNRLFNTPIEIGMRALLILKELNIIDIDLDMLMYLDYLALNTKDIGGEDSIHAPIPNRGVQVYARREILKNGIILLISKELIEVHTTKNGFRYSINNNGNKFLEYFESEYFSELSKKVKWVVSKFGSSSNSEIKLFIDKNIQNWGGEFIDKKTIKN